MCSNFNLSFILKLVYGLRWDKFCPSLIFLQLKNSPPFHCYKMPLFWYIILLYITFPYTHSSIILIFAFKIVCDFGASRVSTGFREPLILVQISIWILHTSEPNILPNITGSSNKSFDTPSGSSKWIEHVHRGVYQTIILNEWFFLNWKNFWVAEFKKCPVHTWKDLIPGAGCHVWWFLLNSL